MLKSLLIKNLAVIKELNIEFEKGFTVLTGETGAGKSVLIDALYMILGGRISKDIIRTNEKSVFVEACFSIEDEKLEDYVADGILIISREIFSDGRNVVKINQRLANTAILKELAPQLISIHSQNDNQMLFNSQIQYHFLDVFGNNTDIYNEYYNSYKKYMDIVNKLAEEKNSLNTDNDRIDYLKFVKKEIECAEIEENEEMDLKKIKSNLKDKQNIVNAIQIATYALYEDDNSASDCIGVAYEAIRKIDSMNLYASKLCELQEQIQELSDDIKSSFNSSDYDDIDINEIEQRLNEIYQIKIKYGGSVESVFERLKNISSELDEIENKDYIIENLEKEKKNAQSELEKIANLLSENRKKSAESFAFRIKEELTELMMPNAIFEVNINPTDGYGKYGKETVEFLFCANAGMLLQPLCKIASGGEISRVNLALKSILYNIDPAGSFVFDEIDAGISGRAAQKTAEKMYKLSKNNQILCVTHLPQIAAMADNQLVITKEEKNDGTFTKIKQVYDEERVLELSRIIGGVSVTELTKQNAKETLVMASEYKEKI